MTSTTTRASLHSDDPLLLDQQLTDDERAVRDAARACSQERLLPRVLEAFRNEQTDPAIFREMGELGLIHSPLASLGRYFRLMASLRHEVPV